ncbi:MAG: phosphoribosylanthranilate isomerase [Deltaproteobacteria bacterium]|nr:phosphoribosylanthranilate isomerase [Deltaproteobacteria bacterium]
MTQVKICGLTNYDDAVLAYELGADALGFIFYSGSPRYISPEAAKTIIDRLGEKRPVIVGVFVNELTDKVKQTAAMCGLDMIQLHGDESEACCREFSVLCLIKALCPAMADDLENLHSFPARAVLVDSRDAKRYGGTGKQSDWEMARSVKKYRPLILAGGLGEANIREAVNAVQPDAVDINSGIEISPGKKDANKMRRVMEIVRTINSEKSHDGIMIFNREK